MTDDEARALQEGLLAEWSGSRAEQVSWRGGAVMQSARQRFPPKEGLAIGRISDRRTGRTRLEARITKPDTPVEQQALKLLGKARAQGADVNVRTMHPPVARLARVAGLHAAGMPPLTSRLDALHVGCSVAHVSGVAGTLGAFVKMPQMEGIGLLSCCHVLALGGKAKVGDDVSQPGWPDQLMYNPVNRVARLTPAFSPFLRVRPETL